MNTETPKVWFITGTSKGIGLTLTKYLLAKGNTVIATTRNLDELLEKISENKENLYPLELDITSDTEVKKAIESTVKKVGKINVVINNAGYCLYGSMEEMTDEEFRATMDVNLYGTANVIRHVMPHLRKQKSGHIMNIASISGFAGNAKAASYNAAKFAVVGLTLALQKEVTSFGINVTLVAPGQFRTKFMESIQYVKNRVEAYGIDADVKYLTTQAGQQSGDPLKLAEILVKVSKMQNPPLRLLLGPDAYNGILTAIKEDAEEFERWKSLTLSTDFD